MSYSEDRMILVQEGYREAMQRCRTMLGDSFFEFCLRYVPGDSHFREIDRFLWESRHQCTRFANHYHGPVVLDLTAWSEKQPNSYFDAFCYFLLDQIEEGSHVVMMSERECKPDLIRRLERFFVIERIGTIEKKSSGMRKIGFQAEEEI